MKWNYIFLALLFVCENIHSQNLEKILLKHSIPLEGDKIIVFLKSNECVNCYKPINLFFDDLFKSHFSNVYVVLEGMNEKQSRLFIKKNFETELKFKKIISDDELFNVLGNKSFSSAIYLKNALLLKDQIIKDDWSFTSKIFEMNKNEILIDSVDISKFVIGNDIPIALLKNNKVAIFDRLQDQVYTYDYLSKKICDSLNIYDYLNNCFNQNFMFIFNDSLKLKFNIDVSKNDKLLKQKIQIVSINSYNDFIIIGFRLVIKEKDMKNGITVKTVPIFCQFNSNLKEGSFHYLKPILDDGKTCTDVLFFDILDQNHFKIQFTNSKRYRDTLCGIFRIENNKYMILEKYLYTKLPSVLPKFDPINKLPNFYKVNLVSNKNFNGYYFWQCPQIFLIEKNKSIAFDSVNFNRNERISNFYTILNINDNNLLILKSNKNSQFLFQYDFLSNTKSKEISISNYNFNDFKYSENKLVCVKSWPQNTRLYVYRLTN